MQLPNTEQNQQDNPEFELVIVPFIEEGIPLPKNSRDAMPDLSTHEELQVRAETIKEIADLQGENIEPDHQDVKDAEELARKMVENPGIKQDYAIYPNTTIAYLAGMVGSMNHMIVKDLADLKLYVVNKLVDIVEHTESHKERIAALRSIGEVDGVDAFKKKTEVTHKLETMEEVEKELLTMLSELKQKALLKPKAQTIDAEIVEDDGQETDNH
jgi:hypothetical protein